MVYRKGHQETKISSPISVEPKTLSIPSKVWTPICAFNFTQKKQACKDLGFSDALEFKKLPSTREINGGNWEVRDGWRNWPGTPWYEEITKLGALLDNGRPNRFFQNFIKNVI